MQVRAPFRVIVAVAVLAGAIELVLSRDFLLDDALIHVRSADLLLQGPVSTVDSSPLFLLLTAAGLHLGASFWVTKLLSVAAFAGLAGVLVAAAWRERQPALQSLLSGLVVLVLSPFGVKWLADGMETSLAVLSVMALALTLEGDGRRTVRSAVLAVISVLVRPELAGLAAIVVAGQLLRAKPRLAAATAVGLVVALVAIAAIFGGVWSDAAVAKLRHAYTLEEFGVLLASIAVGAGMFGVGLFATWLVLLVVAVPLVRQQDDRALLLGALSLPAVLAVVAVRGQAMEGIRPLLPFAAFSLTCLMSCLRHRPLSLPPRPVAAVLALVLVGGWVVDGPAFARIVRLQAQSLEAMRSRDWSVLRGHTGVAWDVGYLAYFTGAPICDAQGLINGPSFARLTLSDRLDHCSQVAEFAYVDPARFRLLASALDMRGWRICDRFDFAHRQAPLSVYLLVAPSLAREPLCGAAAPRVDGEASLLHAIATSTPTSL
jgi:hypothetical protein